MVRLGLFFFPSSLADVKLLEFAFTDLTFHLSLSFMLSGGYVSTTDDIFMIFIHFGISSAFEPGSNVNWTSRTRSGAFGPRFNLMAEPEPAFGSGFAKFAQEPD
jgi:hypothetical protein